MVEKYYKESPPGPRLTVELVPSTSWFKNVRSSVSQADWDKLRKYVYQRANYICEICCGRGPNHPVECHEIWAYDDELHIQELAGLQALCPRCHMAKHLGLSIQRGKGKQVLAHLSDVNGWSMPAAKEYIQKVWSEWEERSKHEWSLNLFYLDALTKELA